MPPPKPKTESEIQILRDFGAADPHVHAIEEGNDKKKEDERHEPPVHSSDGALLDRCWRGRRGVHDSRFQGRENLRTQLPAQPVQAERPKSMNPRWDSVAAGYQLNQ